MDTVHFWPGQIRKKCRTSLKVQAVSASNFEEETAMCEIVADQKQMSQGKNRFFAKKGPKNQTIANKIAFYDAEEYFFHF